MAFFINMFQFKQFTIYQDRTAMKVGTDGVLLGAWADLENASTILDIGTGTGLIALMAAQRNTTAQIDAIEIETEAGKQAEENISASPWRDRIKVYPIALQEYSPQYQYDCIICNPPFFINSTLTPDNGRTLARHCTSLPHPALITNVKRLLKPDGYFCVILPTEEARHIIAFAEKHHLYPQKITSVYPNPGKPAKRLLIKFVQQATSPHTDDLIVELSRHQYSEKYIQLTRDFYLNF